MSNHDDDDSHGVDSEDDITPVNRKLDSNIEDLLRSNMVATKRSDVNSAERERREASRYRKLDRAIAELTTKLEVIAQHIGVLYSKDADDTDELRALRNRFDTLNDRKPMKVAINTTLIVAVIAVAAIAGGVVLTIKGIPVPGWLIAIVVPAGTLVGAQLPQLLKGEPK